MDRDALKRKYSGQTIPQWEIDRLEGPEGQAEPAPAPAPRNKRGRPRKEPS